MDFRARVVGLRARVTLAEGRPAEATSGFEDAIALLGPDDPMLDRALLHQAFGRLLLAQGRRRLASDQLRAAHELLARSAPSRSGGGSRPTWRHAASGAGPRPPPGPGRR